MMAACKGCYPWRSLEPSSIQAIFCFVSGICCLLPACLQLPSNIEHQQLRISLSYTSGFTYTSVAAIVAVIPLFLDILFDALAKIRRGFTSSNIYKSPLVSPEMNKKRYTFLNISERLLVLMGSIILPLVALLPADTTNLGLIYLCCNKCQRCWMGGTFALSLSRYDKEYWSERSTSITVVLLGLGLTSACFVDNIYEGQNPPGLLISIIDLIGYTLTIIPCFIFIVNSIRWLIIVYFRASTWKTFLMGPSKVAEQVGIESFTTNSSDVPDHTFFPMLYTLYGLCLIAWLLGFIAFTPRISDYSVNDIFFSNVPFLIFIILFTTLSMRIVKYEVVQGLYALIDSKKSYVRYISHELRTPLNSAFLGLKLLNDDLEKSLNPRDVDRKDILADVNVACRATLDILNDLLCFDKMESGILVVHKHEVPVLSFISDCVSMFSAQAREGGVTISFADYVSENNTNSEVNCLLHSDTVLMDKFKMDQVLRNLISNALKFTPRGGSVIVASAFIPDSSGLHLSINKEIKAIKPFHNATQPCSPSKSCMRLRNSPNKISCSSPHIIADFHQICVGPISSNQIGLDRATHSNQICTNRMASSKGRLIIVVKDSGTGMLEKDYSRLFREIVQFNPEVLQAGGGSGLGLWITKGIVDLHQGEIRVHSEGLGLGSSFTVELPMERVSVSLSSVTQVVDSLFASRDEPLLLDPSVQASTASFEAPTMSNVGSISMIPVYHLLIVDDSPMNRKMLMRTFRAAGHTCDEAEDGVIAVAKVKEMMSSDAKAYSAILMDFVMPNMDGPTATREIRALGYTAPIFGVTGNTLDSDIDHFLLSGADKVLAKPFQMNAFTAAMTVSTQV